MRVLIQNCLDNANKTGTILVSPIGQDKSYVKLSTYAASPSVAAEPEDIKNIFNAMLIDPHLQLYKTIEGKHTFFSPFYMKKGGAHLELYMFVHGQTPAERVSKARALLAEALNQYRRFMYTQFCRVSDWDYNAVTVLSGGKLNRKMSLEDPRNHLYGKHDPHLGTGTDTSFRRAKRRLDLAHGKMVHDCRELGIKPPAYPSAQIRALCTKYYGQKTHPEFGAFTRGAFEKPYPLPPEFAII